MIFINLPALYFPPWTLACGLFCLTIPLARANLHARLLLNVNSEIRSLRLSCSPGQGLSLFMSHKIPIFTPNQPILNKYPENTPRLCNSLSLSHADPSEMLVLSSMFESASKLAIAAILHGFFGKTRLGSIRNAAIGAEISIAARMAWRILVERAFCTSRSLFRFTAVPSRSSAYNPFDAGTRRLLFRN